MGYEIVDEQFGAVVAEAATEAEAMVVAHRFEELFDGVYAVWSNVDGEWR